jgi:hypothetical protein
MNSRTTSFALAFALAALSAGAQPEMEQWSNVRGIRVDGHLHAFETRLALIRDDGSTARQTAHYANSSSYRRDGEWQRTEVKLGDLTCTTAVRGTGAGTAVLEVSAAAQADLSTAAYLCVDVPRADFLSGSLQPLEAAAGAPAQLLLADSAGRPGPVAFRAKGVLLKAANRSLEIRTGELMEVSWVPEPTADGRIVVRFLLLPAPVKKGEKVARTFSLKADGQIDREPITVSLDSARPGRRWDGIGGNFRLQFPASDPAIIDYCLENLPVTWSRIALWWRDWDPNESDHPIERARRGEVTARQTSQMELARRLAQRGLPVIVSVWDPPEWARGPRPNRPNVYSDPVSAAKWDRIATSIADYLLFLKEKHGVEASMFSFNEPDLGLVPTPAEHIGLIKAIGRACLARGLATKQLLADTSNAAPVSLAYVQAAIDNPEVVPLLGAIGFHTWGGCEDVNLAHWAEATRRLGLPIMITEGGPDAEAHRHPDLFLEPAFQLDETALYVRLCERVQPASIMIWQLTADYTVLKGGGAYGRNGPLEETLRFWMLKQLGATPRGAFALPARADRPAIDAAAFHDVAGKAVAIHLVNTGATRPTTIQGIPSGITKLRVRRSDAAAGLRDGGLVTVQDGRATLPLEATSFTSLFSEP